MMPREGLRPPRAARGSAGGWVRWALAAALVIWAAATGWATRRPLPPGAHLAPDPLPVRAQDLAFLPDLTSADAYGRRFMRHASFEQALRTIAAARHFVVLDYHLFDDAPPRDGVAAAPLAAQLCDALIARRQALPLQVLFITDPVNDRYGAAPSPELARLRAAGIQVAVTDLARLRDADLLYAGLWQLGLSWWPSPPAWAQLARRAANHRKVLIADDGRDGLAGLISSGDPAASSSADSNVAVWVHGPVLAPLLRSELAVARFSGWQGRIMAPEAADVAAGTDDRQAASATGAPAPAFVPSAAQAPASAPAPFAPDTAQVLTEGAIRSALLQRLNAASGGDGIDIAMFQLADRTVIDALLAASRRGAVVRLILDPSTDTRTGTGSGFPNQPVASELVSASDGRIRVAWYRTHGERFHTKLVMVRQPDRVWLLSGSADLTRRSLGDFNLEADVALYAPPQSPCIEQALQYFDTLWEDRGPPGVEYTADADTYADPSQLRYWAYRVMEVTGVAF
jgi:phosphatidylserine/phosphatidylglycerophosphate/cardiolipin synthase-like enzyme